MPKDQEVTTITISSAVFKNVSLRPAVKTDVQIETNKKTVTEATKNKQDVNEVHKIYLPDLETPNINVVLDFATGQLLSALPMQDDELYFNKLSLGDLVYEHTHNKGGLMCLRGAKLELLTQSGVSQLRPDAEDDFFTGYYVKEVPVSYRITTAKGEKYDITVLSKIDGDDGGLNIEYRKADMQIETKKVIATEVTGNSENGLNINVEQPKLFTLSDDALMSLDIQSGTGRIINQRDIEGNGVEFDIYFPPGADSLYYQSSKSKGTGSLTYIDINQYSGYSLKFTLINVESKNENLDKVRLGVGANIGEPGRYRPAFFYLSEKNKSVISSTSISSDNNQEFTHVGFITYLLGEDFTNTEGVTITLKVEAVPNTFVVKPSLTLMEAILRAGNLNGNALVMPNRFWIRDSNGLEYEVHPKQNFNNDVRTETEKL